MNQDPNAAAADSSVLPGVVPDGEVVGQRLGDELVLVHLRTNQIFILNRTGARFWELLESGADVSSIEEILLQEFDVEPVELKKELEGFVRELSSEGLIRVGQRS
jgi:hypothetical protein